MAQSYSADTASRLPSRLLVVAHGAGGGLGRVEQLLDTLGRNLRTTEWVDVQIIRKTDKGGRGVHGSGVMATPRFVASVLDRVIAWRPRAVIFTHLNLARLQLPMRMLRARSRFVVITHGIEVWEQVGGLRRESLQRCDVIWSVSSFTRGLVIKNAGVSPAKVRVLPLALEDERRRRLAEPNLTYPDSGLRILTVTRLDRREVYKGVDHVLRALPRVLSHHPAATLTVVGEGDDRSRLEALARTLGLVEQVKFVGAIAEEELARLYQSCDVFALPSGKEGFGLVFAEAMAAGKPVVAARAGGAPETVRHGVTGLTVTFGDVDAISAALVRLLGDGRLRERMGQEGKKVASTEFTFNRFARDARALLEEVLAGSISEGVSTSDRPGNHEGER